MEIYIVIPEKDENIFSFSAIFYTLFSRCSKQTLICTEPLEKCVAMAQRLNSSTDIEVLISLMENYDSIIRSKTFGPNKNKFVFIASREVARNLAKTLDPGCEYDVLESDTLYRLKDLEPAKEKQPLVLRETEWPVVTHTSESEAELESQNVDLRDTPNNERAVRIKTEKVINPCDDQLIID